MLQALMREARGRLAPPRPDRRIDLRGADGEMEAQMHDLRTEVAESFKQMQVRRCRWRTCFEGAHPAIRV